MSEMSDPKDTSPIEATRRRLAEIDALIGLQMPEPETVRDLAHAVGLGNLTASAMAAAEGVVRGPRDWGPNKSYRPVHEWLTPKATVLREKDELRRALAKTADMVQRARLLVAYRSRWLAIGALGRADRELLARRDIDMARIAAMTPPPMTPAQAALTQINPHAIIAAWAARGLAAEVETVDENLVLTFKLADALNETDRRILSVPANVKALAEALNKTARFAA
jgi:hypothetical protein